MKCLNCNRELVVSGVKPAFRSKYCSSKCKQQAYRNRNKRNTVSVTDVTERPTITEGVIPKAQDVPEIAIPNFGRSDCECKHCQQSRANNSKPVINHGPVKTYDQLAANEINRVSLPGDVDYVGVADKPKGHK